MTLTHDFQGLMRPRLELRHLSLVVALEQTGSVTRAAELLGITQPALSRQIREAERRLGTTLYSREKKRLRPTLAGECLLEHAKRLLGDLARAEMDTIQLPAGPRQMVRLGAGAYSSYRWLPGFLEALRTRAPEIDITVASDTARLPQEAVLQDELDLALAAGPVEARGLGTIHLFDDELVAILPPDHPLAGRAALEAEDFAPETYITHGPTYQKGHETDRVLRPAKVWPKRLIKVELTEAIVDLVAAGLGVSVLSRWAVASAARAGRIATARVTAEGLPIAWQACLRRADGEQAPARRFARELARWCRNRPEAFSGPA
jgi:LysR family transcriptional regulator for metE and metH